MPNKRLGRGINALIQPREEQEKKEQSGVNELSIISIKPNPNQPRHDFDETAMEELTASIKEKGVLTPITVQKVNNQFILVAGERRLRASKKAGLKKIPAHIIEVKDEADLIEMALIENIQRENLNPIEEAEAYIYLHTKLKLSHEKIAQSVGKKRVTISNSLRLLTLPKEIRDSIIKGDISAGHGRAILMLKNPISMKIFWKKIIVEKLSVRAAEAWVKNNSTKKSDLKTLKRTNPHLKKLEDEFISIFGTKVKIKYHKGSGTIKVSYFSDSDLERVTELIRSIE